MASCAFAPVPQSCASPLVPHVLSATTASLPPPRPPAFALCSGANETFRSKQELVLLLPAAVRKRVTQLPPNTHVFRVCLQLSTVIVERQLSATPGFDCPPPGFSTGVVLRVALCGQDCLRSGEGGGPLETAGRAVGKV